MAQAASQPDQSCAADEHRACGNVAFKRQEYSVAVEAYTAALRVLSCGAGSEGGGKATAPACAPAAAPAGDAVASLRLPLLTNRALAHHRLGQYAEAAEDAEAALQLDPSNAKAAFRAAAAHLALDNGIAADRHASLLCPPGDTPVNERNGAPAGWISLAQHAAALAAQQRRVEALQQRLQAGPQAGGPMHQHVAALLGSLQAEAEGEDAELPGGPVHLLHQLAALLGADRDSSSSASGREIAGGEAAAALCTAPGQRGWRLLLFFLTDPDPACQAAAAASLRAAGQAAAAGSPAVLWPAEVWCRLLAAAIAAGGQEGGPPISVAAIQLLRWAAERDAWVRQQLLAHPLPGGGLAGAKPVAAGAAPLAQLTALLGDVTRLHLMAPAAVLAAAQLLQQYASDPSAAEALGSLCCRPLQALLRAASSAEGMAVFQQPGDEADASSAAAAAAAASPAGDQADAAFGGSSSGAAAGCEPEDPELEALQALRRKKRAIYDRELVAVRRALLGALAELAGGCRELLLAESVVREGPAGSAGKRKVSAGPFLTELLALARQLHAQQPRRSTPVLGPDGAARAYAKRRFAADFRDNPAGDFLLSLDLQDGDGSAADSSSSGSMDGSRGSSSSVATPAAGPERTLIELALHVLLRAARASPAVAALLHRRDLLALCDELAAYCTPPVVSAAQQLYATLADALPAAAEELMQSGPGSSSGGHGDGSRDGSSAGSGAVVGLAGLLLCSTSPQLQGAALGKLAAAADTCSGDDFALLTGLAPGAVAADSAVVRAWHLAADIAGSTAAGSAGAGGGKPGDGLRAAAQRFVLRCAERAQRQQGLGSGAAPRGGAWAAIGRHQLQQLLRVEALQGGASKAAAAAAAAKEEAGFGGSLKRGFFAPARTTPAPRPHQPASAVKQAGTVPRSSEHETGGGCSGHAAAGSPTAATAGSIASTSITSYKQGAVVIEELQADNEPASTGQAQQAAAGNRAGTQHMPSVEQRPQGAAGAGPQRHEGEPGAGQDGHEEEEEAEEAEEEVPDLQDVYDSSAAVPAQQRRERAAWAALPLDKKLRWTQTSTDVSATMALPAGTRAADVAVSVGGGRLCVGLRWYGRVLDGPLHRPVKPSETHWCLEGSELHLLLAKADDSWWRALLEGDEQKSFYEVLQEAVHADEPVQAYDQLDDSAKGLIEAIQERQAYINAGLIDPEGFDDFRVVLGENGLGGSGSVHSGHGRDTGGAGSRSGART